MNLEEAIEFLKLGVKNSTALDEFKHIDLSLFSAAEQKKAVECLQVVQRAISNEELTQTDFEKRVGLSRS